MDFYNISLHGFFYFFYEFFSSFFLNGLCRFCFIVFFFKTLWIVTMFPHMVFVLLQCFPTCFFPKLSLSNLFFNIELLKNSALIFPHVVFHFFSFFFAFYFQIVFFFFSIFCVFFQNCFFLFYFFNMELVENLAL
jgi:hypothetical protein